LSLYTESMRLANPEVMPLFVAFKYPAPATTSLTIPVTVVEPDPPVQNSLHADPEFDRPVVSTTLLGFRELSARVLIE